VDADLLGVALENVVRNAAESLHGSGRIEVRTEPAGPAGVCITVTDDGVGMDARQKERAFDEFFTTKASGSGLGLSLVRRVVEAHGGHVSLHSREGVGTVVRLRLPAS
jgi:signal transduction histidine kinase